MEKDQASNPGFGLESIMKFDNRDFVLSLWPKLQILRRNQKNWFGSLVISAHLVVR